VIEITKQILALYDLWKNYDEKKEIAALLNRIPKPKASPSRPPSQGPSGQEGGASNGANQSGQQSQSQLSSQNCLA